MIIDIGTNQNDFRGKRAELNVYDDALTSTCISDIEQKCRIEYGVNIRTEFIDLGYRITVSSKRFPLIINRVVSYESVDAVGMMPVEHLIRDMCRQIKEAEND